MSIQGCLLALQTGPKTNRELQELVGDHGGGVARDMAKGIQTGRVIRVDKQRGRGSLARYALAKD